MKINKAFILGVCLMMLAVLFGCGWLSNEEEARKMVLDKDAPFLRILEEKEGVDKKIKQARNLLSAEKKAANNRIRKIKRECSVQEKKVKLEIKGLKEGINKYVNKIKSDIRSSSSKLKVKKRIVRNLNSSIKEANGLLDKESQAKLTPEERKRWQEKLFDLKLQKKDIMADISVLNNKLSVEKTKVRLLKIKNR